MKKLPISDDDLEWLKLDNQLCFRLYAASKAITKVYRPLLEPLGLTYPQYLVMMVLWQHQHEGTGADFSIKQLGEKLRLDTGTLTPLLKRLEAAGFIDRHRSGEDERVVCLCLTTSGIALSKQAKAVPEALLCQMNAPQEQLLALRDSLDLLLAQMQ